MLSDAEARVTDIATELPVGVGARLQARLAELGDRQELVRARELFLVGLDGRGRSDTLKVHTNYTGRLVGSLTLTRDTLENELSGTTSTALIGGGSIRPSRLTSNENITSP